MSKQPVMVRRLIFDSFKGKLEALQKKLETAGEDYSVLITCDTVCVTKDGEIIEKPETIEEQRDFIRLFSDSYHNVVSWLNILVKKGEETKHYEREEVTKVYFSKVPEKSIIEYPLLFPDTMGAAGGYRIQSSGGTFIKGVEGDYNNVIGMPLNALCIVLSDAVEAGFV